MHITNYIVDESGCWLWQGCKNSKGYGCIRIGGHTLSVHRVSYEENIGRIPKGLHIDHKCRVRHCCNPDHLEPVTPGENSRRGDTGKHWRERSACYKGHEFTQENTRIYVDKTGCKIRVCRTCQRELRRLYRSRREVQGTAVSHKHSKSGAIPGPAKFSKRYIAQLAERGPENPEGVVQIHG